MWSGMAHEYVGECNNESSCFNLVMVLGGFWLSGFQVQFSWPGMATVQSLAMEPAGTESGFPKGLKKRLLAVLLNAELQFGFVTVSFWGFCSTVVKQFLGKFCLGLYCLTPLHELISSCPVRQSSGRTATPFSEHHYPSLWKVMRFMKTVTTFFHPPPQRLLGSEELRSLTNDINIYLKAKQLFSFLLPPHCAALGVQHSHCYIPTLQFSVSSWPAVLSSKGWFLLFVSFLGKKTSANALLQNRQEGQLHPFSMMRAGTWWTWKASCSLQNVIMWLMYSRPAGDKPTLLREPLRHCSTLACPCWQGSGGFY